VKSTFFKQVVGNVLHQWKERKFETEAHEYNDLLHFDVSLGPLACAKPDQPQPEQPFKPILNLMNQHDRIMQQRDRAVLMERRRQMNEEYIRRRDERRAQLKIELRQQYEEINAHIRSLCPDSDSASSVHSPISHDIDRPDFDVVSDTSTDHGSHLPVRFLFHNTISEVNLSVCEIAMI
jgi:hypothetical protein